VDKRSCRRQFGEIFDFSFYPLLLECDSTERSISEVRVFEGTNLSGLPIIGANNLSI